MFKIPKINFSSLKSKIVWLRYGRNYATHSVKFAENYYNFMIFIHNKEFKLRKKLANLDNKKKIEQGISIFKDSIFWENHNRDILSIFKKKYYKINWEKQSLTSQKQFLIIKQIDFNESLFELVQPLLSIVSNYIGSFPILETAQYWYSPNQTQNLGTSQNWHLDGEDKKQLRVFIPIEEIDIDSGPMNAIDDINSKKILTSLIKLKIMTKKTNKVDDIHFSKFDFKKNTILLKENEIGFVDTCNCFHYGSRISAKPRKLIMLHFTSAFSVNTPILFRKFSNKFGEDIKVKMLFGMRDQYFTVKRKENKLKKFQIKIM
tara:strand:+ start:24626 stop:25579 length:954 start_codon:yes stop_codon:yes gene_type:complete